MQLPKMAKFCIICNVVKWIQFRRGGRFFYKPSSAERTHLGELLKCFACKFVLFCVYLHLLFAFYFISSRFSRVRCIPPPTRPKLENREVRWDLPRESLGEPLAVVRWKRPDNYHLHSNLVYKVYLNAAYGERFVCVGQTGVSLLAWARFAPIHHFPPVHRHPLLFPIPVWHHSLFGSK